MDIIKQCWDTDPSKRPKTKKLYNLLNDLYVRKHYGEINKQIEEADKINEKLTSSLLLHSEIR